MTKGRNLNYRPMAKSADLRESGKLRFLIIPHTSTLAVRVRSFELARALAIRGHEVFYWHSDNSERRGILSLARIAIAELLKVDETFPILGIELLRTSRIYRPSGLANSFGNRQLTRICLKYGIDVIISASFADYKKPKWDFCRYAFDFVDDSAGFPGISKKEKMARERHVKRQIETSDFVIASSSSIKEKLHSQYGLPEQKLFFLPNGVWIDEYRSAKVVSSETRKKYRIPNGKRVASLIGNHSKWSGIDFVHQLFAENRNDLSDWVLVLAGPSYRKFPECENVIDLGAIPWKDVAPLMKISDCGLLPFEISDFTANALPLKVLEYSALSKRILCTELSELRNLNWPNLLFLPRHKPAWLGALKNLPLAEVHVCEVEKFDWRLLTDTLLDRLSRAPNLQKHEP